MKPLATLITAALALALANVASAQTRLYMAGSSAYRTQIHTALLHLFGAVDPSTTITSGSYGYIGTSGVVKANSAIFSGTIGTGTSAISCIVKTSWTGSVSGVFQVAGNHTVPFLPDSDLAILTPSGTSGLADPENGGANEAVRPDVAMSDCFQGTTPFIRTYQGNTYPTLTEGGGSVTGPGPVGIVPFEWVATANAPAGMTNMTAQLARAMYAVGGQPLSLFTSSTNDIGTIIFPTGRDTDSGTRIAALAETGVGVNTNVLQIDPATATFFPSETVNGAVLPVGDGGYNVGGTLASAMVASGTTAGSQIYLAYLSTGDGGTVITGSGTSHGKLLSYNGVTESTLAIQQGQYTFWSYEHLLYLPTIDASKKKLADTLAVQIYNHDAAITIPSMAVNRNTDGDTVFSLNF